jgi:NADPH:quinone reductase-like Zn-dependent oxidoreductase
MESLPTTMRAWTHSKPGEPEDVLVLRSDIPVSTPTPTEVLVKISHAALNPGAGIFLRLLPMFLRAKPAIPELDFAGTICHVGAEVPADRGLAVGTQVFGSIPVLKHIGSGKGSIAEYVTVGAEMVCIKPENILPEQAAGLGTAGVSGLVLVEAAKLEKGQKVLINGASGGVGLVTLQIIKDAIGEEGKVVAICSKRKVAMVKNLGADEVSIHHSLFSDFLTY